MAYCKKCGAYIPDGDTKCLACGYDEADEQAAQYAYAYKKAESSKTDYNTEREKRREENRKWAQEEYERRQAEAAEQESVEYSENPGKSAAGFSYTQGNSKIFAMLSYISVGFILPSLFLPDDAFARYPAKQGMRAFIVGCIAEIIGSIFNFGWVVFLLRLGYTIRGIVNAKNGKMKELPYINAFFKKK